MFDHGASRKRVQNAWIVRFFSEQACRSPLKMYFDLGFLLKTGGGLNSVRFSTGNTNLRLTNALTRQKITRFSKGGSIFGLGGYVERVCLVTQIHLLLLQT